MNNKNKDPKLEKLHQLTVENWLKARRTGTPPKAMSCEEISEKTGIDLDEIQSTLNSALSKLSKAGVDINKLEYPSEEAAKKDWEPYLNNRELGELDSKLEDYLNRNNT